MRYVPLGFKLLTCTVLSMILASTSGRSEIIWNGRDECRTKPSGSLNNCATIEKPGRIAFTSPEVTPSNSSFIKTMPTRLIVTYSYKCAGRADETYLAINGKEFPLVFGKENGQIETIIHSHDAEPYHLVRLSRAFSTISAECYIEIIDNIAVIENLDGLKAHVAALKQLDLFLANAVEAATPSENPNIIKAKLDLTLKSLAFLEVTINDNITKSTISSASSGISTAISYLSNSCDGTATGSCTPELSHIQKLLREQIINLTEELQLITQFLDSEKQRLSEQKSLADTAAKIDEILNILAIGKS